MSKRPASDDDARSIVAHLIGGNPNVIAWLRELGLISIDDRGRWQLSPCGEAAIARLKERAAERAPTDSVQ